MDSNCMSPSKLLSRRQHAHSSTPSAALWGHLLQRNTPSSLLPKSNTANEMPNVPLAPVDKMGTSMRILLHDTQATLEKFSERVEKLTSGVNDAQQDVRIVQKLFENDRENLVEETVALVNRCQLEIQKSLGKPAQATELEELRKSIASVDRRLEALDKRFDVLHLLNQTQSQTLQMIQDQQTQLLSSLTPILPLVQSVPLHIDKATLEIKDCIKDTRCISPYVNKYARSRTTTSSSDTLTAPAERPSRITPYSSPVIKTPTNTSDRARKRRRVEGHDGNDDRTYPVQHDKILFSQQSLGPLSRPSRSSNDIGPSDISADALSVSSQSLHQQQLSSPLQNTLLASSLQSSPVSRSVSTSLVSREDVNSTSSSVRPAPTRPPANLLRSSPHYDQSAAPHSDGTRSPSNPRRLNPASDEPDALTRSWNTTTLDRGTPPTKPQQKAVSRSSSDVPARAPAAPTGTPSIRTAALSSISARRLLSRRLRSSAGRLFSPAIGPASSPSRLSGSSQILPSCAKEINSPPVVLDATDYGSAGAQNIGDFESRTPSGRSGTPEERPLLTEMISIGKPMSLKDRRAHGLLTDGRMNEGKRYILLDDDEDDELSD